MSNNRSIQKIIQDAQDVINHGVYYWANRSTKKTRQDKFDELRNDRDELDPNSSSDSAQQVKQKIAGAILTIAAADHKDTNGGGIIAQEFEPKTLELMIEYADYRSFDSTPQKLKRRITDRDDELHGLVQDEITTQEDSLRQVRQTRHNELTDDEYEFLSEQYQKRRNNLREAVALYAKERGVTELVDNIEKAALAAGDAATTRRTVQQDFTEQLQTFEAEIRSGLREQTQLIQQQLTGQAQPHMNSKTAELTESVQELLDSHKDKKQKLERLLNKIGGMESTLNSTHDELEELSRTMGTETKANEILTAEVEHFRDDAAAVRDGIERIRLKQEQLTAQIEELEARRESGSDLTGSQDPTTRTESQNSIRSPVARAAELDFVSRFQNALTERSSLKLPNGDTKELPDDYWRNRFERSNDCRTVKDLLASDQEMSNYPQNERIRADASVSRYVVFHSSNSLVFEARTLAHLSTFTKHGEDWQPATLSDLLTEIAGLTETASPVKTNATHVIALGSPTGWTDKAMNYLSDKKMMLGPTLRVCLVDLDKGKLSHDKGDTSDELLRSYHDVFQGTLNRDRVTACKKDILREYSDGRGVSLSRAVNELEYKSHIIRRAFSQLEQEQEGYCQTGGSEELSFVFDS